MRNYVDAIRNSNLSGKTVVVLEANVGVLAIVAAKAGAKCVYAVEKGKLVETMKELVASNNQESTKVTPEGAF